MSVSSSPVVVTAAVIERQGRFLVTERLHGTHLAGFWEFPGGKCEAGEEPAACLMREIREELAVEVRIGPELLRTTHAYADRQVELHFFRCELLGEPVPVLGQRLRWVRAEDLRALPFPPADREMVEMLIAAAGEQAAVGLERRGHQP